MKPPIFKEMNNEYNLEFAWRDLIVRLGTLLHEDIGSFTTWNEKYIIWRFGRANGIRFR